MLVGAGADVSAMVLPGPVSNGCRTTMGERPGMAWVRGVCVVCVARSSRNAGMRAAFHCLKKIAVNSHCKMQRMEPRTP